MSSTLLELINLRKTFGQVVAVHNVSISVQRGEFVTLLGPSGCGKTTTLRMIAGLIKPTEGNIVLNGREITNLPTYQRNMGMVFQSYALFPHMKVYENVAFGLKMRKEKADGIKKKVFAALEMVQLSGFENRYPRELSGG